jgi:hypothetical protein
MPAPACGWRPDFPDRFSEHSHRPDPAASLGRPLLRIGGYSGGSNPTSVTPILFPVALLLLLAGGLPAMLVCGLLWAGYSLSRRHRGAGREGGSVWHGGARD